MKIQFLNDCFYVSANAKKWDDAKEQKKVNEMMEFLVKEIHGENSWELSNEDEYVAMHTKGNWSIQEIKDIYNDHK